MFRKLSIAAMDGRHRRPGGRRRPLRHEALEPRLLLSIAVQSDNGAPLLPPLDLACSDVAGSLVADEFPQGPADKPVWPDSGRLADFRKMIVAGDPDGSPPDSPALRIDPNTTTSPFAGVGSLRVTHAPYVYLGSATPISPHHVLTAAHMLDLDDNGSIDVGPGDVAFNLNFGGDLTNEIGASALFVHPDWTGFARPDVNDDVALIELADPLPDQVPIYPLNTDLFDTSQPTEVTLVGYGRSGDGLSGYYQEASFTVKRTGRNETDFYELDDEGSAAVEVFEYDFDGAGWNFGGSSGLGNDVETTLGGGDSGGPAFVDDGSGLEIFGINTFTFSFGRNPRWYPRAPYFGSGAGGIVVAPYVDWINSVISGAGVTIGESQGSTDVTEGGNTDTYTVVLDSEPQDDVTITVDPDGQTNLGAGPGAPITLTFTGGAQGNWDVPQVVTVAAVDDTLVEGDHAGTIVHTASSADPNYDGIPIDSVTVHVTDNDQGQIVSVESIVPSWMQVGTAIDVTISGSGFLAGADVKFENGAGPAPAASNIVVVDANTVTATVTAKRGGPPRDRFWDVRVANPDGSSGILADGFTVTAGSGSSGRNLAAAIAVEVSKTGIDAGMHVFMEKPQGHSLGGRESTCYDTPHQTYATDRSSKDHSPIAKVVDDLLACEGFGGSV